MPNCPVPNCPSPNCPITLGIGKKVTNIFNIVDKKWQAPFPISFLGKVFPFRFSRLSLCSRNKLCEIRSVFRQGPAQHYNTFQHAGKVYCLGLCVSGVSIVFHDATFTLWELFNNKTDPLFCFQDKNRTSFHKFFIWRKGIILLSSINDFLAAVC